VALLGWCGGWDGGLVGAGIVGGVGTWWMLVLWGVISSSAPWMTGLGSLVVGGVLAFPSLLVMDLLLNLWLVCESHPLSLSLEVGASPDAVEAVS